jgi:hypothetical protein
LPRTAQPSEEKVGMMAIVMWRAWAEMGSSRLRSFLKNATCSTGEICSDELSQAFVRPFPLPRSPERSRLPYPKAFT